MPGTMESLTLAQQIEELGRMAATLVAVVTRTGSMPIGDALSASAKEARVPASFMKYGLSFAESENLVTVDDFEGRVVAKQLVTA